MDELKWLDSLVTSQIDKFIQQVGGEIMISTDAEIIFKVKVSALIRGLEPIHYFYLSGQRSVDDDRVDQLFESQIMEYQEKKHYGITTTMITLGYCYEHVGEPVNETGKLMNKNQYGLVVIDGQHRLSVFRRIKMCKEDSLLTEVTLVKICKLSKESDLLKYFQLINKNYVPVPIYNLDDQIKGVVDDVITWFKQTFDRKFFKSPDGETNRPFVKMGTIRDKLSNSHSLHDLLMESGNDRNKCVNCVCQKFLTYNKYLSSISPESLAYGQKDYKTCNNAHLKCLTATNPLYLGMKRNYSWIEESFDYKPRICIHLKTPI